MTQSVERRTLLKTTAVGAAAAGGPFAGLVARPAGAAHQPPDAAALVPVPDERDGAVRLHLPEGFRYRSFHDTEQPVVLTDGTTLPGRHDGMGAFDGPRGSYLLVRNHEVNSPGAAFGPGTPYDPMARGGTTTIQVTPDGQVVRAFTSLNGTMMNCSGGQMPWGSWITCEETVNGYDVGDDFTRPAGSNPLAQATNSRLQKTHGFIFEVPADGRATAQPIKSAGRFAHESVAWEGDALYLSEDNFSYPSGFYKYVPPQDADRVGRLLDGGRLYMLKVAGVTNADLARHLPDRTSFPVEWVEIDQASFDFGRPAAGALASKTNDEAIQFVSRQGLAKGAAKFSRLEGTVADRGWIYFTSTQGGIAAGPTQPDTIGGFGKGFGQIWGYDTKTQTLHMLYESPSKDVLDFPDNVTTSARGTLVICEDGTQENFIRALTRQGDLLTIAKNNLPPQPASPPPPAPPAPSVPDRNDEFAGSTFSPDGRTLFVNIQDSIGMSFAIWGPWGRIGV
jgi:uncharacterized protein